MKNQFSNIHPDLQALAQKTPSMTFNRYSVWLIQLLMGLTPAPKAPPDIGIENVFIPRVEGRGQIRVRIYKPLTRAAPRTAPTPMLLWLHGGGYLIGKPEMDDSRCAQYVRALGLTIVSVDYRCAPQHPFPAALEDSYAALQWVAAQAQPLGVDAQRMAIGGVSAGSGLAAALAQLTLDRRELQLIFQLLIYPMLDDRTVLRAEGEANQPIVWSRQSNRFAWAAYLGQPAGAETLPPYAAPARRADLAGLPPAWIGVGTEDLFHAEDVAYAQRLQASGVACEVCVVPGAFHGFDVFDAHIPLVQDFEQAQIAALKKYLCV